MDKRKKKNIMIIALCCALVFIGVGYAAISQTLTINGTGNVSGSWNIEIIDIGVSNNGNAKTQTATNVFAEVDNSDKTRASFQAQLLQPGDYITYDVTVKNKGTIDAYLSSITLTPDHNDFITFTTTANTYLNTTLAAKDQITFTVTAAFPHKANDTMPENNSDKTLTAVLTLNYVQSTQSSVPTPGEIDDGNGGTSPAPTPTDASCFTFDSSTGTITNYDATCGTDVVIPSEIDDTPVTIINGAFTSKGLTSVYIPNTVTTIGNTTFNNNQLTSVTIPSSVTTIGTGAFTVNSALTTLIFQDDEQNPSQLTSIGMRAFKQCNLEDPLVIPRNVKTIGNDSFSGNASLSGVVLNSGLTSIGDNAFNGNNLGTLVIPSTVTEIGMQAFRSCKLTSLVFEDSDIKPSELTTIAKAAFNGNKLVTVVIPGGVTTIGDSAFYNNSTLKTIVIKRENSTGITLGTNWKGSAKVVYDPNYTE